jgi:hypothetical protein
MRRPSAVVLHRQLASSCIGSLERKATALTPQEESVEPMVDGGVLRVERVVSTVPALMFDVCCLLFVVCCLVVGVVFDFD